MTGDEEGNFADALYVWTREVSEEFVFGRWRIVVLRHFAWWWGRRPWILQMLRRLGEVCFDGGDAGRIICGGAIQVVEGFVAGLEV